VQAKLSAVLKLLLGQLKPSVGVVDQGTQLEIVYFDQLRAQLDESMRVQDAVADGNTMITINGRTRHVISYLEDFLFEPTRARTPIKALSGGERNRLSLARLFTKPANVLVLDEPTERPRCGDSGIAGGSARGIGRHGAAGEPLIARSLNAGVHEPAGVRRRVAGGRLYRRLRRLGEEKGAQGGGAAGGRGTGEARGRSGGRPALPGGAGAGKDTEAFGTRSAAELRRRCRPYCGKMENEQGVLTTKLADPLFFKKPPIEVTQATARLHELESLIATAYKRWEELGG